MVFNAFFSWKPLLLTRIIGVLSFVFPAIFYFFSASFSRKMRKFFLVAYTLVILYFSILNRNTTEYHRFALTPFWSYTHFSEYGVRYQIYMNIFLFIPFGFLLSWTKKWSMAKVVLTGCLFSIFIEATQYIFCLGLCEFDDVFHNTLGTVLGHWYWRGLEKIVELINRLADKK